MMIARFADLSGGLVNGLLGGKGITSTGLIGLIPGAPNPNGALGLVGSLAGGIDEPLHEKLGLPGFGGSGLGKLPSLMGQGPLSHGFGDFDGDGFFKGDLGGGPMTEAEKGKIVGGGKFQLL
jgi:hypothetical protein